MQCTILNSGHRRKKQKLVLSDAVIIKTPPPSQEDHRVSSRADTVGLVHSLNESTMILDRFLDPIYAKATNLCRK
jgi:hypothetical protein